MDRPCRRISENVGEFAGPKDYGFLRRSRHRRLITYLCLNGFKDTFRGMLNETNSFMSAIHLSRLVEQGLWGDAISYVSRFLGPPDHPQSDQAKVLHFFLRHHKAFHSMVTGEPDQDVKCLHQSYKRYFKHDDSVPHDALRIRSITTSLLYSEQVRASDIVEDLANKAPELANLVVLPGASMKPQHVLPIGFGFRRRRHVKQHFRPKPRTIAKLYLRCKKRISSSTQHHDLHHGIELTDKTRKWLADIIDESLQAGHCLELKSSDKEGAPVGRVEQTVNFTSSAKGSGISSMANAGTNKNLGQEGCYTKSSYQGSHLRKRPR